MGDGSASRRQRIPLGLLREDQSKGETEGPGAASRGHRRGFEAMLCDTDESQAAVLGGCDHTACEGEKRPHAGFHDTVSHFTSHEKNLRSPSVLSSQPISVPPHYNPEKCVLMFPLIHRWGNQGSER